jgi:hypothetical protein
MHVFPPYQFNLVSPQVTLDGCRLTTCQSWQDNTRDHLLVLGTIIMVSHSDYGAFPNGLIRQVYVSEMEMDKTLSRNCLFRLSVSLHSPKATVYICTLVLVWSPIYNHLDLHTLLSLSLTEWHIYYITL